MIDHFAPLLSSLALAALVATGCATGGAGNATAQGATARGGDAHNEVKMAFSLSLGDAVAKAAADTVRSIMSPAALLGSLNDAKKEEAVQAALKAGLDQAQKDGKTPSPEQKKELEDTVRKMAEAEAERLKTVK